MINTELLLGRGHTGGGVGGARKGGVREGKGRGDTNDGVTMSHTNKHSHRSTVFLKIGTREKYIKLTFKNTWRAEEVPPYTSKLVTSIQKNINNIMLL